MKKNGNGGVKGWIPETQPMGPPYGLSALSRHYGVPSLGSDGIFDATTFGQPVLERPWKANIQPTLNKEGHLNTTGVRMTPISGAWQTNEQAPPDFPGESLGDFLGHASWREDNDRLIDLVKRLIACGVDPDVAADTALKLMINNRVPSTYRSSKDGNR